ncbi:hypothetical protein Egran_00013, partial [Elaphomyces granulatus]
SLNYAFENLLQWVYRATRLRCRLNSDLRVEWSPKISLLLPLQGLHSYLFPISPGASSFSFSDMVQKLSRFDLDVKYDMHCTSSSLIFHSASPPCVFAVHSNSKVGHTSSAASGTVALLFMT